MRAAPFLFFVLTLWAGHTLAADPLVIKFSHVVSANTPKGKGADKFKQLVEARSGGKVKVEVYPNGQLYKDRDEMEALRVGAVQMLAPSLSKFGPLGVREFEIFDLPYMFPNKETLYRTMDGDVGKRLMAKLGAKGIVGLAFWDNGFKQMSANRPLRSLDDFKGLKMRIQSSKALEAQMKALGANPEIMAFSDVYVALQQGVVDGTENPLSNLYTQKMHEVQKHLTISDHGYLGYAVIANKKFWDGLPDSIRAMLEQALRESTAYEREIAQKENDDALEKVRASGTTQIYLLPAESRAAWRAALLSVHREFESAVGQELIYAVYRIAADIDKEKARIKQVTSRGADPAISGQRLPH